MSDENTSDFINEHLIEEVNKTLLSDNLVTPNVYYFDYRIFKDYQVGLNLRAILDLGRSDPARAEAYYLTFLAKLPEYHQRSFDTPFIVDPELLSESEMRNQFNDPDAVAWAIRHSPTADFIKTLDAHIFINANHSQLKENFKKVKLDADRYIRDWDAITFIINTYPLQPSEDDRNFIAVFFMDRYGVNVEFCYHAPKTYPKKLFDRVDEFYLYNPHDLLESPEIHASLVPLGNLKKTLWAYPIFEPNLSSEYVGEGLTRGMKILSACMNVFATFHWLPKSLLHPIKPNAPN